MPPDLRDFTKAPIRGRLEAFLLDQARGTEPDVVVRRKSEVIGEMQGVIVELGPGPGTNLPYYQPDVHVIAVEPNPAMHPRLRRSAAAHGTDVDIRTVHGERIDVADDAADAAVCTLVLCGVDDAPQVIREIKRVVKPGGTVFFYEHVRAPERSLTRLAQRVLSAPHKWVFNGCEVQRDTASLLRRAGFAELSLESVDGGWPMAHTRPRIMGTAVV
ncbi:MAG: class I SAM-dependent methyltransferase [Euzebya sp.]